MTTKKVLGRPKLPDDQAKRVFSLRLTAGERKQVEAAAAKAGQKTTEWARERLVGGS